MISESLKLPICPRCHDTHDVVEMDVLILLYVHEVYPWYFCKACSIRWHAKEGIREASDTQPCFG